MMYHTIECPHCGNPTVAKAIPDNQKCRYCRRLYKVTVSKPSPKSKKHHWDVELVDFPTKQRLPDFVRRIPVFDRDKFGY